MIEISSAFVPISAWIVKMLNNFLIRSSRFKFVEASDKGKKHVLALVVSIVMASLIGIVIGVVEKESLSLKGAFVTSFNALLTYAGSVTIHEIEKFFTNIPSVG